MNEEVRWRSIVGIITCLTILYFFYVPKNTPPISSNLEQYLTTENNKLQHQKDSLTKIIKLNNENIVLKDNILLKLQQQSSKVKIVYYEKYKDIDTYYMRQLTDEFDSIFTKNGIN